MALPDPDRGFGTGPQAEAGFSDGSSYAANGDETVYPQDTSSPGGYGSGYGSGGSGGSGSSANEEAGDQKRWKMFNTGNISQSRMDDVNKISQKTFNAKINLGRKQINNAKSSYKGYTGAINKAIGNRKNDIYSGVNKRLVQSEKNFNNRMGENESYYNQRTNEMVDNATKHKKSQYSLAKGYGKQSLARAKNYRNSAIARNEAYGKAMRANAKQQMSNDALLAKNRQADMAQGIQENLDEIQRSMDANKAMLKTNQAQIMRDVDYQSNLQREQSMYANLRNTMGNALRGTSAKDLLTGLRRVDDMNDVANINAWKQSDDQAYNNWWQANESLTSDYNKQLTSSKDTLSNFENLYLGTLNENNANYIKSMLTHNYDVADTIGNFDYTTGNKFDTFNYEYNKNANDFDYSMRDQLSKNRSDYLDNVSNANYTYREGLSDLAYNFADKLSSFDYNINEMLARNDYDFNTLLQNLTTELQDTAITLRDKYNDTMSDMYHQAWAELASTVPELTAPWNMKKAARGEEVSASGDEGEFTLPNLSKPGKLTMPEKKSSGSKKSSKLSTQAAEPKGNQLSTQASESEGNQLSTQVSSKKSNVVKVKATGGKKTSSKKPKAPSINWKGSEPKITWKSGDTRQKNAFVKTNEPASARTVNSLINSGLEGYTPSEKTVKGRDFDFSKSKLNNMNLNYNVSEYTPTDVKSLFSKPITKMGLKKYLDKSLTNRLNTPKKTASTINKRTSGFIR